MYLYTLVPETQTIIQQPAETSHTWILCDEPSSCWKMATFSPVNHLLSMDAKVLDQALKWPSFPCPTRLDDLKKPRVFFFAPQAGRWKKNVPQWCVFYACTYKLHPFFGGEKLDLGSLFKIPVNFPFSLWYVRRFVVEGEHLRLYFVLKNHVPRQNFLKITPEMPSASPWNWRFHLFSTLFFLGTGWLVDDIIKCAQKPAFSLHVCQMLGVLNPSHHFSISKIGPHHPPELVHQHPPWTQIPPKGPIQADFQRPQGVFKIFKGHKLHGPSGCKFIEVYDNVQGVIAKRKCSRSLMFMFESLGNFHEIPWLFRDFRCDWWSMDKN